MTDLAHAKLSPSGASRWMNCAGAPNAEAGIPDTASSYAEEGTAAHELAAVCLETDTDASQHLGEVFNGYAAVEDMNDV